MDLSTMGVLEISQAVRTKEASPVQVVEATLAAIEHGDGRLNACCEVRADLALDHARSLERRITAGEEVGPLAGVPLGVKDLEDAAGFRTTFGDPVHRDDAPRDRDSLQVARLRAAGCIPVAKTNTPVYGFHAETDNLVFGPTRNPWALSRTAGGSSGGSGAALAAGLLPLATGSDGGGSIRIPSAVCGISGFKPTHGVVPGGDEEAPVWGHYSTRGPMAPTFAEIAVALDAVSGFSVRDVLSVELPGTFVDAAASPTLDGVRIGWCPRLGMVEPETRVVEACKGALERLETVGARVEEVDQVFPEAPVRAWIPRAAAGAWRHVNERPVPWSERSVPGAQPLVAVGEGITADDLLDGEAGMHAAVLALSTVLERFDLLATPAMGGPPPRVGEPHPLGPGWSGDFTLPFNLTRSPAVVVRAGFVVDDGEQLPIGLQLAAPRLADLRLMRAAVAAEQTLGAAGERPPRLTE